MFRQKRLFCLIPFLLATAVFGLTEDEQLQFSNSLYLRKIYDVAHEEYGGFLKQYPMSKHADMALFRSGECLRLLEKGDDAVVVFDRLLKNYPKSTFRHNAGYRRAEILKESGRNAAAIDGFKSVIKGRPKKKMAATSLYFLADLLATEGQTLEAEVTFQQMINDYPDSDFQIFALLSLAGMKAQKPGQSKSALSLLGAAEKKAKTARMKAEVMFQKAEVYFRANDFKNSAAVYAELQKVYPKDQRAKEARLQTGWALHNAGRHAESVAQADTVLKDKGLTDKVVAEWLYLKANGLRQLKKFDEAVTVYAAVQVREKEGPYAQPAHYETALCYFKSERYEEAVAAAGHVGENHTLKKDLFWLLAESHQALGESTDAIRYYVPLANEFAGDDLARDSVYRLGHIYQQAERWKEAVKWYERLLKEYAKSPFAPKAAFARGYCLAMQERYPEAVSAWAELALVYPKAPEVEEGLYQQAMGEIRLQKDIGAMTTLTRLLKDFPKTAYQGDVHYWLGVLYGESKKTVESEKHLRLALGSVKNAAMLWDANYHLAVLLQGKGRFEEAAKILMTLLAGPGADRIPEGLLKWLADFELDQNRGPSAEAVATVLLKNAKDPAWLQIGRQRLGDALLLQKKHQESLNSYLEACKIDIQSEALIFASLGAADMYLRGGDPANATDYYRRTASLATSEAFLRERALAYMGTARSAKASGDVENAAKYFMSVAVLFDDKALVPEALYYASVLYRESGKDEAADSAAASLKTGFADSPWVKKLSEKQEN